MQLNFGFSERKDMNSFPFHTAPLCISTSFLNYDVKKRMSCIIDNFNVSAETKEKIDAMYKELSADNGRYKRGINSTQVKIRNILIAINNLIESISNEHEKNAAQLYSGLIKIDENSFLIRPLTVSKMVGLSQSSFNMALKLLDAQVVKGENARDYFSKTFLRHYPCLVRMWSVRRTSYSFFDESVLQTPSSSPEVNLEPNEKLFDTFQDTYD